MSELRASVVMNLRGNLERNARRYEGSMRQLATNGSRHMSRLQRVTGGLGRTLDSVGNRWTALATGAAGVQTIRSLTTLEERFTRLGIQSGQSAEKMDELRRQIFDTAREANIRVDPAQITSAIEAIVEKTGDLEFAQQNIRNIGLAISATGAEGTSIGQIMAEFQKMDLGGPQKILEVIDTLNRQGKEGAFTLADLAKLGPRVVNAYTAMGRTGPEAIAEMGATLQVLMRGIGDPANTATAFEALLRTLRDADKIDLLQRGGVQVFDQEALEKGREVLRPINEILIDIMRVTGGKGTSLSKVFDSEAQKAFNDIMSEYNRTGGNETLERFMSIQGDGTVTMEDSARAADTAAGAMRTLSTAWQSFADEALTDHIQSAADALNSLDPDTVDRWLKIGGMVGGGIAGLYAIRSLGKLGGDLARGGRALLRGGSTTGGVAGGLGGAVGSMAPVPVFVTNWGGGPGGRRGGGRGGAGGGRAGGNSRRVNRVSNWRMARRAPSLRMLPTAGLGVMGTAGLAVGGAGAVGYGVGTLINDNLIDGTALGDKIGESVARVLAAFGNDEAQRALSINESRGESTVRIQIDQDGRVRNATPEKGPGGPDLDVDSGAWGMWP